MSHSWFAAILQVDLTVPVASLDRVQLRNFYELAWDALPIFPDLCLTSPEPALPRADAGALLQHCSQAYSGPLPAPPLPSETLSWMFHFFSVRWTVFSSSYIQNCKMKTPCCDQAEVWESFVGQVSLGTAHQLGNLFPFLLPLSASVF